jgi:hypothetical protein
MIQCKSFPIKDVEGFNKFIKTVRLAGEQPIKYNENSLFIFYEEGIKFDKYNQLKSLHKSLEEIQINLLDYTQEFLIQEAMVEEYMSRPKEQANDYEKKKFKEEQDTITNAKKNMINLQKLKVKVVEKMIKDIENA